MMASLLQKPENGDDARERQTAERNVQCVCGISLRRPPNSPHVDDVPHRVHHAARAQEQQRLEEGVREQMDTCRR